MFFLAFSGYSLCRLMMIFQGPEGYITPNWYPSKAQHGKVVPTWNFAVVHAYGRPERSMMPRGCGSTSPN
jgi:predicted FMN-binding regulatory protein PaiB